MISWLQISRQEKCRLIFFLSRPRRARVTTKSQQKKGKVSPQPSAFLGEFCFFPLIMPLGVLELKSSTNFVLIYGKQCIPFVLLWLYIPFKAYPCVSLFGRKQNYSAVSIFFLLSTSAVLTMDQSLAFHLCFYHMLEK